MQGGITGVFKRLMGEIYVNEAVATKQYRCARGYKRTFKRVLGKMRILLQ